VTAILGRFGTLTGRFSGDIEMLADQLGIDGRISGSGWLNAHCPFCDSRKDSFGLNLESGGWICHKCGESGSLAKLVQRVTGRPEYEVSIWLGRVKTTVIEASDDYTEGGDEDGENDHYWRHAGRPPATALKERRITPEAADELEVRWGPVWNPETQMDTWEPGWVLPMRHVYWGNLMGFQGKVRSQRDGSVVYSSAAKSLSLFGIEDYEPGNVALLVESPLDVAVFRSAGLPALGTYGCPSLQQFAFLRDYAGTIILAFDRDAKGQQYTRKALESGYLKGQDVRLFRYPNAPGNDPGELVKRLGYDVLKDGIKKATTPPRSTYGN
jgi:hypothetical protein